jgi:hypothetical protein
VYYGDFDGGSINYDSVMRIEVIVKLLTMIFGPHQLSVYSRLNILYLLDSLCENAFQMDVQEYKELVENNLVKIKGSLLCSL